MKLQLSIGLMANPRTWPIFDGRVASLKRFTEDVREVATGFECGVMLEGFETFQVGDVIEFYHKEKEE